MTERTRRTLSLLPHDKGTLDIHLSTDGGRDEMFSNVHVDLKNYNDLTRSNWYLKNLA